ncbi:hypothetical protein F5882DRAFT_514465 [Hyaloscypha sp. PMI_1271]|nr:hypothetical protein F5882DRAFT_514465 [Hyaloscypha sp. PMI_1271]
MATTNKAYELPQGPIIFKARGIVSDVRLNVFGTLFHVHSSILKLYSHYFFSYLDALGSPTAVAGTAFKYDWTTKVVDAGGDWQLVSNNEKAGDLNVKHFKGDPNIQALAFYKLVCVMYSLPFVLRDPGELIILTAMARFYAALPVLSRSLLNTIPRSPGFLTGMQGKAVELLVAAKELRHPELFKDCLLLCLGPWGAPEFNQLEDHQLKSVAIHARKELCFGV